MRNCNKTKYTCGDTAVFAECVSFEGTPNPQSDLVESSCISEEDVSQDQYNQLEEIWNEIDLSELGDKCLEYVETEEGKVVVKNVLLKFEEEICALKEKIENLENTPLCNRLIDTNCLDLKCLTDACSNTITTYGELFQALIDNACPTP